MVSKRHVATALLGLVALVAAFGAASADERFIVVASTTSTENSGLFDHILPQFTAKSGIEVRVVAKGTGQAIKMAEAGDADVLFVHHRPSEDRFVAEGYGVARHDVMFNDFVLIGPRDDPAGAKGTADVTAALAKIAAAEAPFVSRGDDSGTHKKERGLWAEAGLEPAGAWYREAGSGMGATMNTASAMNAYTLADRGTWIAFANKGELVIISQSDTRLFNPYGVILVNPDTFPHAKAVDGQAFIDWLVSPDGQESIAAFKAGGQQLFFPNVVPMN